MLTNKLIMNRDFYIQVYNELESGKSYPKLAEELNIPVIKAFPAFTKVVESVQHSRKLKFYCLVHKKAPDKATANRVISVLNTYNYFTIDDLKDLASLSLNDVKKRIDNMSNEPKIRSIIFSVIKSVKGA